MKQPDQMLHQSRNQNAMVDAGSNEPDTVCSESVVDSVLRHAMNNVLDDADDTGSSTGSSSGSSSSDAEVSNKLISKRIGAGRETSWNPMMYSTSIFQCGHCSELATKLACSHKDNDHLHHQLSLCMDDNKRMILEVQFCRKAYVHAGQELQDFKNSARNTHAEVINSHQLQLDELHTEIRTLRATLEQIQNDSSALVDRLRQERNNLRQELERQELDSIRSFHHPPPPPPPLPPPPPPPPHQFISNQYHAHQQPLLRHNGHNGGGGMYPNRMVTLTAAATPFVPQFQKPLVNQKTNN